MLHGTVLAVVGAERGACERLAAPLRDAGAVVSTAVVHLDALATLSASKFDAVILDIRSTPEPFAPLTCSLRDDPRTRLTPLVGMIDGEVTTSRIAPLGLSQIVASSQESDLPTFLADIAEQARAAAEKADALREVDERLRVALDRLAANRADSQSLVHDARVLCGIVLGFASNLRDDVVGALESGQRAHVRQIIDTANDMAAILERFGESVRAQSALLAEPPPSAHAERRSTRRTLVDLAELARTTIDAFANVAAQKRLTLLLEAPTPVHLWADGLQLKQVVVNLLVNALKFTPAEGRVTVSVRLAAPPSAAEGAAIRTHAEIAVSDTGPGIPHEERERIFERGVRLKRDDEVPGNGLGLAVARDIVKAHDGGIRAEETAGGGATLVVALPVDMRARRDQGILLIEDADVARRVVSALRELRERSAETARMANGTLAAALEHCRAVVVVPRQASAVLSELLVPTRSPAAANR